MENVAVIISFVAFVAVVGGITYFAVKCTKRATKASLNLA